MWSELSIHEQTNGECSSLDCDEHPIVAFEAGNVVSVYCCDCARKIERMRVRSAESNRQIDELENIFGPLETR